MHLSATPDDVVLGVASAVGGIASFVGAGVALVRPLSIDVSEMLSPRVLARAASGVVREVVGAGSPRRYSSGPDRTWIEVHGVHGSEGPELVEEVQSELRAIRGVQRVDLHRPWERVVVTTAPDGPSLAATIRVLEEVERRFEADGSSIRPVDLPGDDGLLARQMISLTAVAAGLGACLLGRVVGLPYVTAALPAPIVALDYQPRLRAIVESALGPDGADLVFSVATAAAYTLAQAPSSLAVETAVRVAAVGETLAARRAWRDLEPTFAKCAADAAGPRGPCRPPERAAGPAEHHADRSGVVGLVAAGVLGAVSQDPVVAGHATIVSAPKATRSTRELFAATFGRGLPSRGVLPVAGTALRHLDRVDALVIDPRVLYTSALDVTRIVDVADRDRARVWSRAQRAVVSGRMKSGWHAAQDIPGEKVGVAGRVLVGPVHDGYASVLLAEARRAGIEVISADDEALRSLRNGFDRLQPFSESMDRTLLDAVEDLHESDRVVAVVAADAPLALADADVGIGVLAAADTHPWGAHLLADDLTGVWRILHALPAARSASRRGVQLSLNASALGALMLLPGGPGRGPEPVTAAAALGVWTGYATARSVLTHPEPESRPLFDWHAMTIDDVAGRLSSPPDEDVVARAAVSAATAEAGGLTRSAVSVWEFVRALRKELSDPLTPVLATCAAASAVLGSPTDAVLVGSVLMLNAAISATQRLRAERILKTMLSQQDPTARLVVGSADGSVYAEVPAVLLAPGHTIEVRSGEVAPADGRLVDASGAEVDESLLTGESLPVTKQTDPTPGAPLAERTCMIYAGTTVLTGTVVALVTAVGDATESRRATAMAPAQVHAVGMQSRLRELTGRVLPLSFGGGALVGILGLLRRAGLRSSVVSGVSVLVAAVPEGLPLVATLAQSASARRLTSSDVLVRTPNSIEALGRVDVVCFDKTGTLSENRLRVQVVEPVPGYEPEQVVAAAARTAFSDAGKPTEHATDAAIVDAARGFGEAEPGSAAYLPFRPGRSFAAALTGRTLVVKGAPEVMAEAYTDRDGTFSERVRRLAEAGLRVIAVGERVLTAAEADAAAADPEELEPLCRSGLGPVGLLGLSDTPRAEAKGLLAGLEERGIGVRLITGDHPVTAVAIAGELGLPVADDRVISGTDWDSLSLAEREDVVRDRLVFARMTPEHKVQIVQMLERSGRVCAMVGDGANDAAAIRTASVGIGVASHGSDPARGAADVVLLEGKVGGLIDAVDEGRRLWQRVTAAIAVLLGGNAGEVVFAIIGSLVTGRSPLNARQLLLVNMLTDALPAAALALGTPNGKAQMGGSPGPDRSQLLRVVAIRGGATAAGATLAWAWASMTGTQRRASTVALVGSQLGQTLLDSRSPLVVATVIGSLALMAVLISVPGVSHVLGCVPVGPVGWAQALGSATAVTAAAAVVPALFRRVVARVE